MAFDEKNGRCRQEFRPVPITSQRRGTEVETEKVGPQQECENTFPKSQVQKPDREEPGGCPHGPHEGVLLDTYFLRFLSLSVRLQVTSSVGGPES